MNRFTWYLWCLFGFIVKMNAQLETDWKPIVGPNLPQSLPLKLLPQQPISSRVLSMPSRSRSTITFNGQTITTNIGDIGTNDAAGSVLAVDSPDFISDIDNEPNYVGYRDGKVLNGFLTAAAPVSSHLNVCGMILHCLQISHFICIDRPKFTNLRGFATVLNLQRNEKCVMINSEKNGAFKQIAISLIDMSIQISI